MSKQVTDTILRDPFIQDDFVEDFQHMDVVGVWAGSGDTAAILATDGDSAVILNTGTTDNHQSNLRSVRSWDISSSKPLVLEARVLPVEQNTNTMALLVGVSSAAAINHIVDGGATVAASYSGACFFKPESSLAWSVQSSLATAQTTNITQSAAGGSTYQNLRIEITPTGTTTADVVFSHGTDGNNFTQCKDATTGALIVHEITYTSFAPAFVILSAKTGSTDSEIPRVDLVRVSQVK